MKKVSGEKIVQEDMQELMRRLNARMEDGFRIFSQKRTRNHFEQIFFSRYKTFSMEILKDINAENYQDVISFYENIDDLYWYLMSTEDMPAMVETNVRSTLKKINSLYAMAIEKFVVESSDIGIDEDDHISVSYPESEEVVDDSPPPFDQGLENVDEN